MAMKWLLDFREGILTTPDSEGYKELSAKIDILAHEVNLIKQQKVKTSKIKMINGKSLGGVK